MIISVVHFLRSFRKWPARPENNIMVDLETLGTGLHSAIVSIGAIRFDLERTFDTFSVKVDLQSCFDAGLQADGDTLRWWMQQSDDARRVFIGDCRPLEDALDAFAEWMGADAIVWGNGAAFDNVVLANAYRSCDKQVPWHHFQDRCYRTIKNLCPDVKLERQGIHHNALDDATSQAEHLIECMKTLRLGANV